MFFIQSIRCHLQWLIYLNSNWKFTNTNTNHGAIHCGRRKLIKKGKFKDLTLQRNDCLKCDSRLFTPRQFFLFAQTDISLACVWVRVLFLCFFIFYFRWLVVSWLGCVWMNTFEPIILYVSVIVYIYAVVRQSYIHGYNDGWIWRTYAPTAFFSSVIWTSSSDYVNWWYDTYNWPS